MISFIKSIVFLGPVCLMVSLSAHGQQGDMHDAYNGNSKFKRPLSVPSNEATKKQLALAKAEGDAVDRCVNWLIKNPGEYAGTQNAGEYKVTWILSRPEGWYVYNDHRVSWISPAHVNAHLWLFVQDGADHRIVPPLDISLAVLNSRGETLFETKLPYAWMPLINGYGNNIELPGNGDYTFSVKINPPSYHRHDPYNGDRFTDETYLQVPVAVNLDRISSKQPLSEAMEKQKDLARLAGHAYAHTLKNMYKQANDGRDTVIGDYKIAFAVEYAEGFWDYEHGVFRYKVENDMSGRTNAHVEIAPLDAKTGRFLDNLNVTATLFKKDKKIGSMHEHFMWHPWLYHYGDNWRVPSAGNYNLQVQFEPPAYRRYGRTDGRQFLLQVDFIFNNIKIKTGQK
ncbi:MAG: iron transporter [Bacteroidetes bacterium]|nr:iron transporter [Bacteroidota bacterium]